jgi:hypothetical protein
MLRKRIVCLGAALPLVAACNFASAGVAPVGVNIQPGPAALNNPPPRAPQLENTGYGRRRRFSFPDLPRIGMESSCIRIFCMTIGARPPTVVLARPSLRGLAGTRIPPTLRLTSRMRRISSRCG